MQEARFLDNVRCNINNDIDCNVYPLTRPDSSSLTLLSLNYLAQFPILIISAGAGFTTSDKFSRFGFDVLIALLESSIALFLIPGLVLMMLNFLPVIPALGIWLIQDAVGNLGWIIYLLGVVGFSLNVLISPN